MEAAVLIMLVGEPFVRLLKTNIILTSVQHFDPTAAPQSGATFVTTKDNILVSLLGLFHTCFYLENIVYKLTYIRTLVHAYIHM
jgi:hypothetical protein